MWHMLKYAITECFTIGELYMDNHKWEYINDLTDNSVDYSEFMTEGTYLDDEYENAETDVTCNYLYQEPIELIDEI